MKDTERIIEDAKKAGVDMSWLREAKKRRVQSPEGMSSGAGTLLEALRTDRANRPTYQPRPPGTPTLQYKQHKEGVRQFDEDIALRREKMEADEEYRRETLARDMATAEMGGIGDFNMPQRTTAQEIDALISQGASMDDIEAYVFHPDNIEEFKGIEDRLLDYAERQYGTHWSSIPQQYEPFLSSSLEYNVPHNVGGMGYEEDIAKSWADMIDSSKMGYGAGGIGYEEQIGVVYQLAQEARQRLRELSERRNPNREYQYSPEKHKELHQDTGIDLDLIQLADRFDYLDKLIEDYIRAMNDPSMTGGGLPDDR